MEIFFVSFVIPSFMGFICSQLIHLSQWKLLSHMKQNKTKKLKKKERTLSSDELSDLSTESNNTTESSCRLLQIHVGTQTYELNETGNWNIYFHLK